MSSVKHELTLRSSERIALIWIHAYGLILPKACQISQLFASSVFVRQLSVVQAHPLILLQMILLLPAPVPDRRKELVWLILNACASTLLVRHGVNGILLVA